MAGLFSITVDRSPALQRALGAPQALLQAPIRAYLERAGKAVADEAAKEARKQGVGERLAGAHVVEVDHSPLPAWAQVQNTQPYALFVHGTAADNFTWGRRPGARMPPPDALAEWAAQHGLPTDHATLFLLARSIGEHGIKARPWLRDAAEHEAGHLRGALLEQLAADIAARWAGSR